MSLIDIAFNQMQDLKLWFKLNQNSAVVMSDYPDIIPMRWNVIKDQWGFLGPELYSKVDKYSDPDKLRVQIESFTVFVNTQRVSNNSANPLDDSSILKRFYAIWDNLEVGFAPLSELERKLISERNVYIGAFIKEDFKRIRNSLVSARNEIADLTGHNDETYDKSFQRSPVAKLRDITGPDTQDMDTFQQGVFTIDFILSNITGVKTISVDPFALAKANAANPEFDMNAYRSASMVRMNVGESLQALAFKYLNDVDKWIDIATANGLRPPYIDEVGTSIKLIANGDGNTMNIVIPDSGEINANSLYMGQPVFLESDTLRGVDQRTILNIKIVPVSGDLVLELSGNDDLNKLKTEDNAAIRVYKPNTINSNFFVAIPSVEPIGDDISTETPFFLAASAADEKRAGVDLAINGDGDLSFTSFGDIKLSYGLDNAIQAVQLKVANEQGQIPRHPEFGLVSLFGQKITNPSEIKTALITSLNTMIDADDRFDRINNIYVEQLPPGVAASGFYINLEVKLAGSSTVVPLTFTVNV